MSLEDSFNAVAFSHIDEIVKTPSKTPSKSKDGEFNISTIPSTTKKLNYMNSSFHENQSFASKASSMASVTSQLSRSTSVASSSLNLGNCTSVELLQGKIDHLEKERLELSLQLHNRSEKERANKIKLEQLENSIKSHEENKKKLIIEVTKITSENQLLRSEKNDLQSEITRLMKEIQSVNHFETKDLWQKMTNLSSELKRIEKELISNNQEKNNLQKENAKLLLESQINQEQSNLLTLEITELRQQHQVLQQEFESVQALSEEQKRKCDTMQENIQNLSVENQNLLQQMTSLTEQNVTLLEDNQRLSSELSEKSQQLLETCEALTIATTPKEEEKIVEEEEVMSEEIVQKLQCQDDEISVLRQQILELKDKLFENERKRKQLHNKLQEYKGNIRVLIRCRPFLSSDMEEEQEQALMIFHEDKSTLTVLHNNGNGRVPNHQYSFDHVFQESSTQEDVYKEVTDLVQSVLDGYRVCIFSYGQTGSGKTHTMTGERVGQNRGIIPRAFEELLDQSKQLKGMGWDVNISLSIVELYNEEFRDLLLPAPSHKSNHQTKSESNKEKIKISYQNNRTMISGLTNHTIALDDHAGALEQFHRLLDISSQARTTASTNMNEFSSRSHLIVLIDFIGKHTVSLNSTTNDAPQNRRSSSVLPQTQAQSVIIGGLKLCDLAGSERLDRTNTLHDQTRLKETVNINKSLSCLSDVFNAINNKQSHVPFRNSKLTMLLQDCLSGDGKSLMFVNISPTMASLNETICSLRFANQVSQVELGKAQKNIFTTAALIPQSTNSGSMPTTEIPQPPTKSVNTSSHSQQEKERHAVATLTTFTSSSANSSNITTSKPFSKQSTVVPEAAEEVRNDNVGRIKSVSNRSVRFEQTRNFDQYQETENIPQNILLDHQQHHVEVTKDVNKVTNVLTSNSTFINNGSPVKPSSALSTANYSFLSNGKPVNTSNTSIGTMNEKLQNYLQLKQRNLGTSQRRSSVLQTNTSLLNPARSSLLPSSSGSGLDTSVSFIGKRDVSQIVHERSSFTADGAIIKKTRVDSNNSYAVNLTSLNANTNSKRYNWR